MLETAVKTREIKFRAWIPEAKEFVYWSLLPFFLAYRSESDHTIFTKDVKLEYTQQFTGLYDDVTKKEIYEGDIVQIVGQPKTRGAIEWLNGSWNPIGINPRNAPISIPGQMKAEVIGNIHENPELLK